MFRVRYFFAFVVARTFASNTNATVGVDLEIQGCVGAIAGIPLHGAVDGSESRGALLPALLEARAFPASWFIPGSICLALGNRIILVDNSGTMSLLVGGSDPDLLLPKVGAILVGTSVSVSSPHIAPGPNGKLFFTDVRGAILTLDLNTGLVKLVAGNFSAFWSPDGSRALDSTIGSPLFVEVSQITGDVYFGETSPAGAPIVRAIRASGPSAGLIETVAGDGSSNFATEGSFAAQSGFSTIVDAYFDDATGDLLVAEQGPWTLQWFISNSQVHIGACVILCSLLLKCARSFFPPVMRPSQITRVTSDGIVHVVAGNIGIPWTDWFVSGTPALTASLSFVTSVCTGPSGDGDVYFAEQPRVVRIKGGILYVLSGQAPNPLVFYAWAVFVDGAPASTASIGQAFRVRPDHANGAITFTDPPASVVYRIYPESGAMETVAGRTLPIPITPAVNAGRVLATQAGFPSPNDVTVHPDTRDSEWRVPVCA